MSPWYLLGSRIREGMVPQFLVLGFCCCCCLLVLFSGLYPSKAFPWIPGLVCNHPAWYWLWVLDQGNNDWLLSPAMVMKKGWGSGWHFCPSGTGVRGTPLSFQKWLRGQDCQEAARESGLVLSPDWLADPRGWDEHLNLGVLSADSKLQLCSGTTLHL